MQKNEFLENLNQLRGTISYYSHTYHIAGMTPDDICQEIILRIWSKKELYDLQKANFNTWAQAVIRNLLKNLCRDAERLKREPLNKYISIENLEV